MMNDQEKALLAPFEKIWTAARKADDTGNLLMRAAFQVRDQADADQLKDLAEKMRAEGRRLRRSVPRPTKL